MNKMEVELKSDWLVTQIEVLKCLHGYELKGVNDEIGILDYVASVANQERRLLRVMTNPKVYTDEITRTINSLEKENYDEVVILANDFTKGAENLIEKKERLSYISSDMGHQYSIFELNYAIEKKTWELCKLICGKPPKSESGCKGYQYGEYTCKVRRISDEADFHSGRKWLWLVMNDFSKLVALQREMDE